MTSGEQMRADLLGTSTGPIGERLAHEALLMVLDVDGVLLRHQARLKREDGPTKALIALAQLAAIRAAAEEMTARSQADLTESEVVLLDSMTRSARRVVADLYERRA